MICHCSWCLICDMLICVIYQSGYQELHDEQIELTEAYIKY